MRWVAISERDVKNKCGFAAINYPPSAESSIHLAFICAITDDAGEVAEETMSIQRVKRVDEQLVRGIGMPALTANIISCTIGAGIFVLPALVARNLGPAAPLAFIVCAIAMVLFVTCFAIAGSRVSLTGGLYAYVEVAFGR